MLVSGSDDLVKEIPVKETKPRVSLCASKQQKDLSILVLFIYI